MIINHTNKKKSSSNFTLNCDKEQTRRKQYAQLIINNHYDYLQKLRGMINLETPSANNKRRAINQKFIINQDIKSGQAIISSLIYTITDLHDDTELRNLLKHNRRRIKPKRTGGYPKRKVLLLAEVKDIKNTLKAMRDHGFAPNLLITINPPVLEGESTAKRKQRIGRIISTLGTILKRQKLAHYGLSIYEQPKNGELHAHHAIYVPPDAIQSIKKWIEKKGIWDDANTGKRYNETIHCCPYIKGIHDSYLTKEAQYPCPPDQWRSSKLNRFRPRCGNAFRGKRIHKTKGLINLINNQAVKT